MMGLTPLITWAVLDPVMKVVITEMQGSSPVKMRVWALRLAVKVTLDVGFELHVWDVGFKLCAWALKWYWDAGFELCILALQWCWDAGFEPCVLALHEWLWLTSYLKHEFCYLMTYFQWFLDSLQNPLKSFGNSTEAGFETLWTSLLAASSQDWVGNLLR